jgi:hypothetical protein
MKSIRMKANQGQWQVWEEDLEFFAREIDSFLPGRVFDAHCISTAPPISETPCLPWWPQVPRSWIGRGF